MRAALTAAMRQSVTADRQGPNWMAETRVRIGSQPERQLPGRPGRLRQGDRARPGLPLDIWIPIRSPGAEQSLFPTRVSRSDRPHTDGAPRYPDSAPAPCKLRPPSQAPPPPSQAPPPPPADSTPRPSPSSTPTLLQSFPPTLRALSPPPPSQAPPPPTATCGPSARAHSDGRIAPACRACRGSYVMNAALYTKECARPRLFSFPCAQGARPSLPRPTSPASGLAYAPACFQ